MSLVFCDSCGATVMRSSTRSKCWMTPRCFGKLEEVPKCFRCDAHAETVIASERELVASCIDCALMNRLGEVLTA